MIGKIKENLIAVNKNSSSLVPSCKLTEKNNNNWSWLVKTWSSYKTYNFKISQGFSLGQKRLIFIQNCVVHRSKSKNKCLIKSDQSLAMKGLGKSLTKLVNSKLADFCNRPCSNFWKNAPTLDFQEEVRIISFRT